MSGVCARGGRLAMLAVLVVTLAGCSVLRSSERTLSTMTYPPRVESLMGQQFAEEIEQEYPVVRDEVADAWLTRMGERLVDYSPSTSQQFRFQFVDSPDVNAFAIPGGYCYVNIGLVLFAENEAQVAAVVGHEINHVTRRHGILSLQRARGIQTAGDLFAAQVTSGAAQQAARATANAGGYVAMRKFGREDEHEADYYGVRAMYGAGYDPREAVRFFQKLHGLQGGNTPSFLERMMATHPATQERVARLEALVAELDLTVPLIKDSPEFHTVQQRLRAKLTPRAN